MKKVIILFLIGLFPNVVLLIALYIYDPLQLYHKPFFRNKNIIDLDMRYQGAGVVNTWDFNSLILGTSMLQNTSNAEAKKKIGGEWVNLSMAGSTLYERRVLLQYALKKQKIKQVILSLEPNIFLERNKAFHTIDYDYLYDNNYLNDFKIYLNESFLFCMLRISNSCLVDTNPDYPIAWFNTPLFNQTFGGFQNWLKKYDNKAMKKILKNILVTKLNNASPSKKMILENLDQNILKIAKSNPKIAFFIIFPPFSTLYYKLNSTNTNWNIWKDAIVFLLNAKLKNLKVYGFDNEIFTNQIERYKDLEHYDEKVNSFMLDAIKNDTHRITLENIDSYFEAMKKKVEAYDIEPLRKQIIESGVLSH